jgi:predicted TIM-barrel fold metal-dependent hydrolase
MTPLFDTNAHPVLAGGGKSETFSHLARALKEAGFFSAAAVGLPAKEGFDPAGYITACRANGFYPVARWPNIPAERITGEIASLRELGYPAIKIHPRLSGMSVRDPRFAQTLKAAVDADMVVFHCCFQFEVNNVLHPIDPLPIVMEAAAAATGLRMVMLHGGTVEVLRYAECIRKFRNLLLDLSLTLNRYEGSSLDQDIAYLFRAFDQRICLGSDYPDYQPSDVRRRFEQLSAGLQQERKDNIAWKNITSLLGIVGP